MCVVNMMLLLKEKFKKKKKKKESIQHTEKHVDNTSKYNLCERRG